MNILWAVKGQTHESWGMHFSKVLTQRPKKKPRRGRYPQTHNPLNVVVGAVSTQNMLNHSKSASYNPHLSTGKPSPLRGCTDKGCLVWDHPKRWRLKTIFSWIPDSWGTPRLASTQKVCRISFDIPLIYIYTDLTNAEKYLQQSNICPWFCKWGPTRHYVALFCGDGKPPHSLHGHRRFRWLLCSNARHVGVGAAKAEGGEAEALEGLLFFGGSEPWEWWTYP